MEPSTKAPKLFPPSKASVSFLSSHFSVLKSSFQDRQISELKNLVKSLEDKKFQHNRNSRQIAEH